jgi:membrane protease YdiL (CAAX protease family)
MVTPLDLLYVALLVVVFPAIDYLWGWPAFRRRNQADPAAARRWMWKHATVQPWLFVAVGMAIWLWHGRPWAELRLNPPEGWRLVLAIALILAYAAYQRLGIAQLRRDPALRERVRASMGGAEAVVPHTRAELRPFTAVSITAGFCEEFLCRGYLLWALTPWLGWWGAAALSVVWFGLAHAYQGWGGVLRTGAMGAIYVLLIALFDSLWPTIVLHALVDACGGLMAWVVLREDAPRVAG